MKIFFEKIILAFFLFIISTLPFSTFAYEIDSQLLLPKANIYLSPQSGNYYVGDNFEIPIYINTLGHSINVVSIKINFDPNKIKVISPSGGNSILSIWLETPNFDNQKGTISMTGMIPNGLVTSKGLIGTIVFRAISPGRTNVFLTDFTSANLNDGFGTNVRLSYGNGLYNIYNKISKEIPKEVVEDTDTSQIQEPIIIEHFILEGLVQEEIKENLIDMGESRKLKKSNFCILFLLIIILIIGLIAHYFLGRYFHRKNTENTILDNGYQVEDGIEKDQNNTEKPL